jgi:hypothetical protein
MFLHKKEDGLKISFLKNFKLCTNFSPIEGEQQSIAFIQQPSKHDVFFLYRAGLKMIVYQFLEKNKVV